MIGGRQIVPTESMRQELASERQFVRDGHDFLDQKRILLAGRLLALLERYEVLARRFDDVRHAARAALARALARHGASELAVHPAPLANAIAEVSCENFVGNTLVECRLKSIPAERRDAVNPSPEARAAARAFAALVPVAVELAGVRHTIETLLLDYRKTERRARALEDVILPELDEAIAAVDLHLEAGELEEATRVRARRGE